MGVQNGLLISALTRVECREKLKTAIIGRLGITVQALPVVLPVYFVATEDSIVIRTMMGTKLSAALGGAVVAFEIDGFDSDHRNGWSVLVQGRASVITDEDQLALAERLPLETVSPGGVNDHFILVAIDLVSGRTITPFSSVVTGTGVAAGAS